MSSKQERFSIAVLDDYQHVALSLADCSALDVRATFAALSTISRTSTPSQRS